MFAQKNCNDTTAWQIDSQEKLFIEIDRTSDELQIIILNSIYIISIEYVNEAKDANKQCNRIQTIT